MTSSELKDKLNAIFRDVFDDDQILIDPHMTAADISGWDSLAHIRLIVSVERNFGVNFTVLEIDSLENVGGFLELIAGKLSS